MDTCKSNLNKSSSIARKSQFVYDKQTSSRKVLLYDIYGDSYDASSGFGLWAKTLRGQKKKGKKTL